MHDLPETAGDAASSHPYARLTPDVVLDAVERAGLRPDGRVFALNSYENRVYTVWLDDAEPVVAKFYRPGRWTDVQIAEEHAFVQALADAEVPVVAPIRSGDTTLYSHADFRFALYPRQGGRNPDLEQSGTLEWIGRYIGRIHAVGARIGFAARPTLTPARLGRASRDYLSASGMLPADLHDPWERIADLALQHVDALWQCSDPSHPVRLHGDCHPGNLLWTESGPGRDRRGGPHFVDFDDCCNGPPVQDLWMLLSGDRASMSTQLGALLRGYRQFAEFDTRTLGIVEPLRTLRLLHYSAWLARRWSDPAFPAAFPWFGSARYWQDRILELREQVAAMQEPPLEVA